MKKLLTLSAVVASAASANAATLISTTYLTNTTYTDNNGFVQSGTTTWTINPGVTLTATTGRFFIGEGSAPNTTPAIFVVTGGGALSITNTNAFTMRLGQNETSEIGVLRIEGGSTFSMTGNQGPWSQKAGSNIVLSGLGSTFIAEGTYNSGTGLYNRGVTSSEALAVSALGGTLQSSYDAGTNMTTLSVVPEPSTYGLLGAGALAGVAFVRRRRKVA